jgi:hypothetical protein
MIKFNFKSPTGKLTPAPAPVPSRIVDLTDPVQVAKDQAAREKVAAIHYFFKTWCGTTAQKP